MGYTTFNPAEAFLAQNGYAAETLEYDEIAPYAEHHAGGLVVLGEMSTRAGYYVKVHDTWGEAGPNGEEIIVHEYPLDEPEGQGPIGCSTYVRDGIWTEEWSDASFVWYFATGREAFEFFLARIGES